MRILAALVLLVSTAAHAGTEVWTSVFSFPYAQDDCPSDDWQPSFEANRQCALNKLLSDETGWTAAGSPAVDSDWYEANGREERDVQSSFLKDGVHRFYGVFKGIRCLDPSKGQVVNNVLDCSLDAPSGCPEAGTHYATNASLSSPQSGQTSCQDGCEVVTVAGASGIRGVYLVASGERFGDWAYTGNACSVDDGPGTADTGADCAEAADGSVVCRGARGGPNCGLVNGERVCLESIPTGGCVATENGGVVCISDASTPPVPDNGTPGVPAVPDATLEGGAPTAGGGPAPSGGYYGPGTVAGSSDGGASSSPGASGVMSNPSDTEGQGIDETGTPTGTDSAFDGEASPLDELLGQLGQGGPGAYSGEGPGSWIPDTDAGCQPVTWNLPQPIGAFDLPTSGQCGWLELGRDVTGWVLVVVTGFACWRLATRGPGSGGSD